MDDEEWNDRRQRHLVQLEADLLHSDGGMTQTIVSDLSLDGCKIVAWLRIGDVVRLRIPRIGEVQGQVRWAMNGRAGVRFLANVKG